MAQFVFDGQTHHHIAHFPLPKRVTQSASVIGRGALRIERSRNAENAVWLVAARDIAVPLIASSSDPILFNH